MSKERKRKTRVYFSEEILVDILSSPLFKKTHKEFFGGGKVEVIKRPHFCIVRLEKENKHRVIRFIILPPGGCTSDTKEFLNPHPEARRVKVYIFGEILASKKGFRPLVGSVEFRFAEKLFIPTSFYSPYAKYREKDCRTLKKTWKSWFYVVKENGWGNFHNLVNCTKQWVVLVIDKQLFDRKKFKLEKFLNKLSTQQAKALIKDVKFIERNGDEVFRHPEIIRRLTRLPLQVSTPVLLRMLNVQETGKHQNCTFFAILLKLARRDRVYVRSEVRNAIKHDLAPNYYLEELHKKLL